MSIDDESVTTLEDLRGDLAQRYKRTPTGGSSIDSAIAEADMAALDRDGYVIWENLLSAEECAHIRQTVRPWLGHTGRNSFEGRRTQRIYSVLSRTRVCDRLVDHPRVLAALDRLLMPNYLLSALQAINIQPGEAAQLAHHDDGFYPIPRPRAPLAAATIWAIDDFTADNGATVLYPGSHRWGRRRPGSGDEALPVVMPAGSCVFFVGTLWHGGGANNTAHERLAITAQYCEPWLRPMEAYTLSVSRDIARTVSDDIRRMLGYSIHPPFVGNVDGLHPLRLLGFGPEA
ncbi:phytanoyl-CoA dioxygenase family protein [Mycobacterium intracellulare]|uniref:Phytanoyl-CoA dioxygenase family protein n=1 Tax=Mycobacterium intracellulare TaxID=1767 RepID=A0AAE4REH1_MYCIT|nr:phytanoyl-CoA dioxygenase family protein [Mycobacterium intracellulare]MCA2319449.1 phytanoyl-CoA dioxygenase family protein [Mycobacterium intracellulare]MCA2339962.1 phytanoyl-CoA dioxygenase family protein [Mycobacterium intracellulare]MDV6976607.1 phytanoyl-CoA dioxygenase family protein [Mycobacterium intracellulare]MDV6981719.1 phytanoyl-CoA dioxygenase family protein [Mycobacterium intracellulare]MDV7012609.1 phytanoyl-CoA dioxygenase family protein [Mycobacterium intracellulare]